ncbi:hypothetical protein G7061_00270 [Erysipelothrix sp. HDW6B]|uniref:hypothetical protein n=1 Tax=Erysipelothrix sp. HDW6B TaxID=2714929 RepID=UPI00140B1D78|nr:hypothetical protein [Erysipelothrix sp. HDW6B]QIK85137.1 hypothetical protein G7061_00270 [Erysipelothrix sp. HDW6B]
MGKSWIKVKKSRYLVCYVFAVCYSMYVLYPHISTIPKAEEKLKVESFIMSANIIPMLVTTSFFTYLIHNARLIKRMRDSIQIRIGKDALDKALWVQAVFDTMMYCIIGFGPLIIIGCGGIYEKKLVLIFVGWIAICMFLWCLVINVSIFFKGIASGIVLALPIVMSLMLHYSNINVKVVEFLSGITLT